jgi:large subunit ribosomal protein L30
MAQVKITWIRSAIGRPERQKRTVRALGLRKLQQTTVKELTPQIQGMINRIPHLLRVEEVSK